MLSLPGPTASLKTWGGPTQAAAQLQSGFQSQRKRSSAPEWQEHTRPKPKPARRSYRAADVKPEVRPFCSEPGVRTHQILASGTEPNVWLALGALQRT